MNARKIISLTCLAIFVVGIAIGVVYFFKFQNKKVSLEVKNLLTITSPVTTISGQVVSKEEDSITVNFIPSRNLSELGNLQTLPNDETLNYKIKINSDTQFSQPSSAVAYIFKSTDSKPPQKLNEVSIKDIVIGQKINITLTSDLRVADPKNITASYITLPFKNGVITGVITSIQNLQLKINTNFPDTKTYDINVSVDTEISRSEPNYPPISVLYKPSDLKVGMQVIVYSDADVTETDNLNALRIEPLTQIMQ